MSKVSNRLTRMFSARINTDSQNCSLTTVLQHGQNILVIDYANRKAKSFSLEGIFLSEYCFEKPPRRACITPDGEILVTLQGAYMIATLIKIGFELFFSHYIVTAKDYSLVEAYNDQILICAKCGYPGCIDTIDYRGQILKTFSQFTSDGLSILFPSYLSISPSGKVLMSELRNDGYQALISCDTSGNIYYFYQGEGQHVVKCPSGVATDRNGMTYLACRFKHKIYCLYPDGKLKTVLLKENDVMNPGSIFVTPSGSTIMVTEFGSEMVKIFELHSSTDIYTENEPSI